MRTARGTQVTTFISPEAFKQLDAVAARCKTTKQALLKPIIEAAIATMKVPACDEE